MAHIYTNPGPAVEIPEISVAEYIFRGLEVAHDRPIFTEVATGRQITGGAAMDQIRKLAGGLIARGLEKGDVVAVMAPNSIDYFLLYVAVTFAGGTLTPVNPSYKAAELVHQLEITKARTLVVDAGLLPLAQEAAGASISDIFCVGDARDSMPALAAVEGPPLEKQVPVDLAEDLVAIPFSSGTTGLPKGVMLTHQNIVSNASIWQQIRSLGPEDVTPTFLPFFHIFGLTLMQTVYPGVGGHVHLMQRFNLEEFLRLTQDTGTQKLWVVPPVAIALAKSPEVDKYDLLSVSEVGSGAAPLSFEIGDMVGHRLDCQFYSGYGMTEVAGVASAQTPDSVRQRTLGAPLPNTSYRIVDPETLKDCESGHEGEIWIKGPVVMKGYLSDAEATSETITPDGWLRTGDIGSFNAEGYLTIHDRLKEMIKVKGFQVAPAEVEAAMITHPLIADSAVVGVPDDEAGEVPLGFVVFVEGASLTLDEVQEYLRDRLVKYKVIQHMEVLDEIPKAASGKILRRVLRKEIA